MNTATYRDDLYYVNIGVDVEGGIGGRYKFRGRREYIVNKWMWWLLYRPQFWRFEKFHNFNVLREKDL